MAEWTEGYVSDIQYTSGFYREMAPSHLAFAALLVGCAPGDAARPKRYLELASGQGVGTCLLAAANPETEFVGIDFNSAQTANACRLADAAGLNNVQFRDWSFQETLTRADADSQDFDIVALHGIYSWISAENRTAIVEILRRRLKPGGLSYISYNCMPGWAAMQPVQRLIREFAARNLQRSDRQVSSSITFLNELKSSNALFFTVNPSVEHRLEQLAGQDPQYLAHEYLNENWYPLYFADVAAELGSAKLSYVASATLAENVDAVSVPPGIRAMVKDATDPVWAETLRDYATNKRFRRDVFGRGVNKLTGVEHRRALFETKFVLAIPPSEVVLKFKGALGEFDGKPEVFQPILQTLGQGPATFGELAQQASTAKVDLVGLLQSVAFLVSSGQILLLLDNPSAAAHRFNQAVVQELKSGRTINYLAAPASGSGIHASTIELFGLAAVHEGIEETTRAAAHAFSVMKGLGQRPRKEGTLIADDREAIAYLEDQFNSFFTNKLPVWKQLGIL